VLCAKAGKQPHSVISGQHHVKNCNIWAQFTRHAHGLICVARRGGAAAIESQGC
jgi:hypothetical protein